MIYITESFTKKDAKTSEFHIPFSKIEAREDYKEIALM